VLLLQERLDAAALAFKAERAKMAEEEIIAMEVKGGGAGERGLIWARAGVRCLSVWVAVWLVDRVPLVSVVFKQPIFIPGLEEVCVWFVDVVCFYCRSRSARSCLCAAVVCAQASVCVAR
jgi:hypothetical protein